MNKKLSKSEFMSLVVNHIYKKKLEQKEKENMAKEYTINTGKKIKKRFGRK